MFPHVQQAYASVQQAHLCAQQVQPPPAANTGGAVDSTNGSDVTFRPVGARGNSSGPNGCGTPPPFPSFASSQRQQTQGQAFTFQVKPKDPPMFHGRVDEDVIIWTAKVQDFLYLTDAGDI